MFGVELNAAIDLEISSEYRLESRVHLLDPEIGQVTEAAVVDAKYEDLSIADQPRCRQHRAVTAEHDDEISSGRGPPRICTLFGDKRLPGQCNPLLLKPVGKLVRGTSGVVIAEFYHDPDR